MTVRIGINGFGRMGRALVRIAVAEGSPLEVVAVNDLAPPDQLAKLVARDSVYGRFPQEVVLEGSQLTLGPARLQLLAEPEVKLLPWGDLGIDVVVEATGRFTSRDRPPVTSTPARHGWWCPPPAGTPMAPSSWGSTTTSSTRPATSWCPMRRAPRTAWPCWPRSSRTPSAIEDGLMTTVHAYTGDQRLVDAVHKDPRRARAAAINIIPTTTGAARATGTVLPALGGHLDGLALRVPVPDAR